MKDSSGSTYIGRSYSSRGSRNFKLLDSESRCTFIVFAALALVSAASIALGAHQFFGPVGSAGFNISIGGGGLLGLISIGCIVYQVREQCKKTSWPDPLDDPYTFNFASHREGNCALVPLEAPRNSQDSGSQGRNSEKSTSSDKPFNNSKKCESLILEED